MSKEKKEDPGWQPTVKKEWELPCGFCLCSTKPKIPYSSHVCPCPCHLVGSPYLAAHLAAVRHYFPEDAQQERRKILDSLLIKLSGLGVVTPEKGFRDIDEVCWHIDIALKDAKKGKGKGNA